MQSTCLLSGWNNRADAKFFSGIKSFPCWAKGHCADLQMTMGLREVRALAFRHVRAQA